MSFISDPSLREVIARTLEFGAKGKTNLADVSMDWSAEVYGSRSRNDIIFVSAGPFIGSGYFTNVAATERAGAEASLKLKWRDFDARASYAYVDATYDAAFAVLSPFNPAADANGNIFVRSGDELPNIPHSSLQFAIGYAVTPQLHVAINGHAQSGQYLRGDEANLQSRLPGFAVFGAQAEYELAPGVAFYVAATNIFDRRYATFGLYGDPTANGAFPQFANPLFIVPAAPAAISGGIGLSF